MKDLEKHLKQKEMLVLERWEGYLVPNENFLLALFGRSEKELKIE